MMGYKVIESYLRFAIYQIFFHLHADSVLRSPEHSINISSSLCPIFWVVNHHLENASVETNIKTGRLAGKLLICRITLSRIKKRYALLETSKIQATEPYYWVCKTPEKNS